MTFKDYKHCTKIQVRFNDIDRLGHVNNACYLTYFETSRMEYFDKVFRGQIDWSQNGFIIARTEINHLQPVHLNDEVYCFTRVAKLGNKSMVFRNSVVKYISGKPVECAEGISIMVTMDYTTHTSIPIPEQWKKFVILFENGDLTRD